MKEFEAWRAQLEADRVAAAKLLDMNDASTYCHTVAKLQQVVEKSINAIDAVLREYGYLIGRARSTHYPERMLSRLRRLPKSVPNDIGSNISEAVGGQWSTEIFDLCSLAPKLPATGDPYPRNTEYPFNLPDGSWTAPALAETFRRAEVERFQRVADHLVNRSLRIISAVARGTNT